MAGLPFPSDSDTALEAFLADIGFGAPCPEAAPAPSPSHPDTTAAAATDEPVMAGDDQADEERRRRLRRRISNRESARRCLDSFGWSLQEKERITPWRFVVDPLSVSYCAAFCDGYT
ncbi:hypothetical protein OsJ_36984 [Oryza sativa Japonica Group]|uniref:Uncharacterized protein n=1 Tax=Oryza sativa subsp. japonica TaxID=39947 RepID=B9GEF5_ORYSJ|nr:hypothetical protein OsJ_36984 [Oryza sativa Japonica Group]